MTKEFEKLIIEQEKINEAKKLAHELGYWENYLDGSSADNPNYFNEMRASINKLVGQNWPKEVTEAYEQGSRDGFWDS